MRFRPASLQVRIIAAFAAGMLVMMLAVGTLVVQYQQVGRSQQRITDGYLPLAKSVARLTTWQARIDNDVRRLIGAESRPGTGDSSPTAIFMDKLEEEIEQAQDQASRLQLLADTPEEVAALRKVLTQIVRVEQQVHAYRDETERLMAMGEEGAFTLDATGLLQLSTRLGDDVQTLTQQVDGRIAQLTASAESARRQATVFALGLSVLALVVASVVLTLALFALRPIGTLTRQVQRLAAGDYSGRVEVRGDHEIAVLAGEFNTMVGALRERDTALVDRAEELDRLSDYLTQVVDSLQEGLLVIEDGDVTLTNPAARTGWKMDDQQLPEALASVIGGPSDRIELLAPSGRLHEVRLTPFAGRGTIVSTADITDATQAQARLARSERLALIGQMLAQITHEVRNPLNALSLNAEMLADELHTLDPDRKTEGWDLLALITSEIDRLTSVTGHYLQLARRPPARPDPTDLAALILDVERLLAPDLEAQGVKLDLHLDPIEPVLADGNQLRRAVMNVIRNAAEAGAHQLDLTLSRSDGQIRLALQDDGPGMPDVERAVDPFYTTKPSGTGLGLAITRQILEDHDGTVQVICPGQGTTVAMTFPSRSP